MHLINLNNLNVKQQLVIMNIDLLKRTYRYNTQTQKIHTHTKKHKYTNINKQKNAHKQTQAHTLTNTSTQTKTNTNTHKKPQSRIKKLTFLAIPVIQGGQNTTAVDTKEYHKE